MKVSDIPPWLGPRQLLVAQERSKTHKIKMSTNSAAVSVSWFINHNFVEALKALLYILFVGKIYEISSLWLIGTHGYFPIINSLAKKTNYFE